MKFFVGLHQPSDAKHISPSFISVNRLRNRKSNFLVNEWIMDSGAFTEISTHGHYRYGIDEYIRQIERWRKCGNMLAAVTQDYMCEPFIIQKTGLTVEDHQRLTVERYQEIQAKTSAYIMPVLQGYLMSDYLRHIDMYGYLLKPNMWVGVGSICKRNSSPGQIEDILLSIKRRRPDLRLHGFGLKITSLESSLVRDCLYSADSLAWSFTARKNGRNPNDFREAISFLNRIKTQRQQTKFEF